MSPARNTPFGSLPDGQQVQRATIARDGLRAHVLTYGATLQDLRLDGVAHPLVLGWPSLDGYLQSGAYFGAIVGRFANRIAQGRFRAGGRWHQADRNFLGRHCLHGGGQGSDKMLWMITEQTDDGVTLALQMPDCHMGFPGNLSVTVTYAIRPDATLEITIKAQTDQNTPCGFAPHGYFALGDSGNISTHDLTIQAERYLPVDADLIPTGEKRDVAGTPFDFRQPRKVGTHPYDHNLCLSAQQVPLREVAQLTAPGGALSMTLGTTEPGLQVYTNSQFNEPDRPGLQGRPYGRFAGVALEPQLWPDAMNQPGFPTAILTPDALYRSQSQFRFRHHI
ncbi:aldose epimerase family protein [Ruegeria hyattellae]|uniref:aldose epimerase family protein n=1 Tax=Ruegeria hyattellae TaxID=3233337 RepID=UPI00355AE67F